MMFALISQIAPISPKSFVTVGVLLLVSAAAGRAQSYAVRMADATIARNPVVHEKWDYTAGVVLLGIKGVGGKTGNPKYAAYVKRNIDALVQPDGNIKSYEMDEFNLDQVAEGRLLFNLYAQTHDARYRKAIEMLREQLRKQPRTSEGGFWHKKIYPNQMWLDGLYMASPFLAQYGAVFNDTAAFNDVAKQILLVARSTRDPATGLYFHAWDETRSQNWADTLTGRSRNFWGRAVGWYAMAIVDVLDYLPRTHRDRAAIINELRQLASAVKAVQDPVSGLWHDVLDQPTRKGNYLETSASSMFVYAFAKGARLGLIDSTYASAARRGYDGLVRSMVSADSAGRISLDRIVAVSGLGGKQQ
ncbi:MAG TPA: glycoside hydrolase family 88 protein, partial [Longimicrobiales bacterium]|nr:glycoside hydrolase family 88 protein [Longimicrobiales bacterium]